MVANDRRVLEEGVALSLEERTGSGEAARTWLVEKFPIRDADSDIVALGGLGQDITDRRRALEALETARDALAQQARMLDATQATARLGGWELDLHGGRLRFTREAFRLHDLDPDAGPPELAAILACYSPADRERLRAAADAALQEGLPFEIDVPLELADGRTRYLRIHGRSTCPAADDDVERLYGTVQDITAQRSLEARLSEARQLEGLGRLAGGIAHDFNNLLTIVQGGITFLREALADRDDAHEELREMAQAVRRGRDLTSQMLAFAQVEPRRPRQVDLAALVSRVVRLVEPELGPGARLECQLAAGLGPVTIDPHQLEQVISHMIFNARDAMPDGGRLRVSLTRAVEAPHLAAGGPFLVLTIEDEGVGMPPEIRDRIFQPFFSTHGPGRGSGLGLSMAYGVIRQAGGVITVASEPGDGARFDIYLPEGIGAADYPQPDLPGGHSQGTGRVLLVEDDRAVRRVTARALERAGYEVLTAAGLTEALEVAADPAQPLDILVTDVVMAEADGIEVARQVLERRPGLPVLYVSGYAVEALAARGLDTEGLPLLPKPFTPDDLSGAVRLAMDR